MHLACGLPYQNLRTALEQILNRMVDARQAAAEALAEQTSQPELSTATTEASARLPLPDLQRVRDPYRKRVQEQRRAQRRARYEQVLALHQEGMLQQEIAERLHIGRATVSRYLQAACFRNGRRIRVWKANWIRIVPTSPNDGRPVRPMAGSCGRNCTRRGFGAR
jgi:DNA invertase Pin-like site-specific DNA recombinase